MVNQICRHSAVLLVSMCAFPLYADDLPGSSDDPRRYVAIDEPVLVLRHARVIDGTGAPARSDQMLIIKDGLIKFVGTDRATQIPDGARVIDLTGRAVLPGLVMLHEHINYYAGRGVWHAQPFSFPRLFLAFGVTTIRTVGNDTAFLDLNLKLAIEEGRIPGPRMIVSGPIMNGYTDHFIGDDLVRSATEAQVSVAYWATQGVEWIKIYEGLSHDALSAVITEAHRRGIRVTGHLGSIGCQEAAELGIDNIEHGFETCFEELMREASDSAPAGSAQTPSVDDQRVNALFGTLISAGVAVTTTPVCDEQIFLAAAAPAKALELLVPRARDEYTRWQGMLVAMKDERKFRRLREMDLAFYRAGGKLLLGSDVGNAGMLPGFTNIRAIEILAENGFTPLEAIRIATLDGAQYLGVGDQVGSIEPGKRADLLARIFHEPL